MFTEVFIQTTNPNFKITDFLQPNIAFKTFISIITHAIIYTFTFNLGYYCIKNKFFNYDVNKRFLFVLILFMIFGYIGRVLHIKDVYKGFNYNLDKTSSYVNQHYNSWIFIG